MQLEIKKKKVETPLPRHWLTLIMLGLVWGCSFLFMKRGLVAFSAPQVSALRISMAGVAFLPIFLWHIRHIQRSQLKYLLVIGMAGSGLPAILFPIAQTHLSSSAAGVLSSLTPLFTLLWSIIFFKSPIVGQKIVGVAIGLLGAAILVLSGKNGGMEGNLWYGLLVVLACACYGLSINIVKEFLQNMDSVALTSASFVLISIPALFYLFSTDFVTKIQTNSAATTSLSYIILLAMVGTVAASLVFYRLVQETSPLFAATVSYLMPLTALFLGALDGEPITFFHLSGMTLILGGVYITNSKIIKV